MNYFFASKCGQLQLFLNRPQPLAETATSLDPQDGAPRPVTYVVSTGYRPSSQSARLSGLSRSDLVPGSKAEPPPPTVIPGLVPGTHRATRSARRRVQQRAASVRHRMSGICYTLGTRKCSHAIQCVSAMLHQKLFPTRA